MSLSIENEHIVAQVVKKRPLSITEAGKNVRDFLKLGYVAEQLSAEDYTRLSGLQEVLLLRETKKRKHKRTSSSEMEPDTVEPDNAEPDRKKRRRRCVT